MSNETTQTVITTIPSDVVKTVVKEHFNKLMTEHASLIKYAGHIFMVNGAGQFNSESIDDYKQEALIDAWKICNKYAVRTTKVGQEIRPYSEIKKLFKNALWTRNKYVYRKMHFKKYAARLVNLHKANEENESFLDNIISKPEEQFIKENLLDKINIKELKERFMQWLSTCGEVSKNDLDVYDLLMGNKNVRVVKQTDIAKHLGVKHAQVISSINKLKRLFVSFKEESLTDE